MLKKLGDCKFKTSHHAFLTDDPCDFSLLVNNLHHSKALFEREKRQGSLHVFQIDVLYLRCKKVCFGFTNYLSIQGEGKIRFTSLFCQYILKDVWH